MSPPLRGILKALNFIPVRRPFVSGDDSHVATQALPRTILYFSSPNGQTMTASAAIHPEVHAHSPLLLRMRSASAVRTYAKLRIIAYTYVRGGGRIYAPDRGERNNNTKGEDNA